VGYCRVWNPKGKEQLEILPAMYFQWTENPMVLSMFPVGSKYFGNEIRQVMDAPTALKHLVLPRYRKDKTGMKVGTPERVADPAAVKAPQQMAGVKIDAAKVRIEFQEDGKAMEEEVYIVVYYAQMPITPPSTYWIVDCIVCFKAEKGKLDDNAPLFQTIAHSFRLDPQWFNKYNQITNMLIQQQIQRIHAIGQISRMVSQTYDEISKDMMDSYNYRQETNDRLADNFCKYIRGVDEYHNPIEERPVELPSGYDNAWVTGSGEYVLSDDANFNPNVGSTVEWRQLERRE